MLVWLPLGYGCALDLAGGSLAASTATIRYIVVWESDLCEKRNQPGKQPVVKAGLPSEHCGWLDVFAKKGTHPYVATTLRAHIKHREGAGCPSTRWLDDAQNSAPRKCCGEN